ncbi:CHAT domain-containing protein [Saccharothrix algeriensis]|uniref:CHAT domain-containing protein n=1 Tax=Saccharothrix algeriensis TaxID=173560 RepID=A0A8T8HTY5_9PSEU|nr:CHAT domain-containing protein [Saccharothrix algeriensis]QTR01841.1 CHAT domain-containing protein [Saccharothrix algeriensis]
MRVPLATADPVGDARELHRKGKASASANRYLTATRILRRGLALLDGAAGGPDPVGRLEVRIRLLITLSFCHAETEGLEAGLTRLATARDLLADLPGGALRDELTSLVNGVQGVLLFRVGRIEEGIAYVDLDVAHHERLLAAADDPTAVVQSLVTTLTNRGNAYGEVHRIAEAVRDLDRAVELAAEHDLPLRAAIATHALGNVLRLAGDIPQALRRYQEANRAFRELEPGLLLRLGIDQAEAMISVGLADEAGRLLDEVLPELRRQRIGQDVAEAELYRGAAALADGDLATARRMARSAQRRLVRRGSPAWAAVAGLIELRVDVLRAIESRRSSPAVLRRALELAARLDALRLPDQATVATVLAARMEVRHGNLDSAADLLRGVAGARRFAPIDHRMLLRLCRAELALARGNRRVALAQAKAGLAELGRLRDRMGGLELVSGTALHGRELGDLAVRLVLRGGDSAATARRLFTWLERTRAQLYRYDPVESTVDSALSERIAEVRRLSRALLRARLDGLATGQLEDRLAAGQREAMRLGWSESPWGRPRPVATADEVVARLGDRALVSFAACGDELVAVVLAGGRVRMRRLGSAEEATERARRLHADLNALAPDHLPPPLAEVIAASARREAENLDRLLLRPLAGLIGQRELVVVPTGALHVVPWGVLPTCANRPTVAVPSATSWLSTTRADGEQTSGVLLVRGPGLQAAQGEIDRLAGYHRDAKLLGVADAKVGSVLDSLDGVDLAHIAAHGEHEPENALFSRLELVDGALFAHEVGRVRRPPRRVVLAACELALNRVRPGDEPLGFAGALLAGGARTVIAASSRVGDKPSAEAMADFHHNLAAGASPAVALAEAVAVDPLRRPFVCLGSG